MKVKLKSLGLSEILTAYEDRKVHQLDFAGSTVKDILDHLSEGLEPKQKQRFEKALATLFIAINGRYVPYPDRLNARLCEKDFVEFFFDFGG